VEGIHVEWLPPGKSVGRCNGNSDRDFLIGIERRCRRVKNYRPARRHGIVLALMLGRHFLGSPRWLRGSGRCASRFLWPLVTRISRRNPISMCRRRDDDFRLAVIQSDFSRHGNCLPFILLRVRELCGAGRRDESGGIGESLGCLLQCSDGRAAPFTSFRSFNRTQSRARSTRHAGQPCWPASHKTSTAKGA
jgi:hypothetical protein